MPVRILGEDLALFRTPSGKVGLVGNRCPHRAMDMSYGIPEEEGLRCPYHGWLFNFGGQCVEMPAEPPASRFHEKVTIKAYPAEEMGGLVWAYLGPAPIPFLPKWDLFAWDNVSRSLSSVIIPCNWLQTVDQALDPTHVEHLHAYYGSWSMAQRGADGAWNSVTGTTPSALVAARGLSHRKIGFDRFKYGIIKRRITDADEQSEDWKVGHPIIFPTILRVGGGRNHTFLIRVPVDDEHTWHVRYQASVPQPGQQAESGAVVAHKPIELYDADGRILAHNVPAQDMLVWLGQGPMTDRTNEHLGLADVGVIMYRRLLNEQIGIVEDGGTR